MTRRIETRTQAIEFLEREKAYILPTVTKVTHRGEREWNIFSRLLKDRIVFIGTEIDDFVANAVIAQFLFLESEDPEKDIQVYINSPGGVVTSGLAMYDTMQYVRCPVSTMCIGQAASMGAVLLAAGQKGRRFALPHARVMIHQPLGGARGPATDIRIEIDEMMRTQQQLYEVLARHTGKSLEQITTDCDRNNWMSAEQSVEYGLADKVLAAMPTPSLRPM